MQQASSSHDGKSEISGFRSPLGKVLQKDFKDIKLKTLKDIPKRYKDINPRNQHFQLKSL
jgi:hypothetical protein